MEINEQCRLGIYMYVSCIEDKADKSGPLVGLRTWLSNQPCVLERMSYALDRRRVYVCQKISKEYARASAHDRELPNVVLGVSVCFLARLDTIRQQPSARCNRVTTRFTGAAVGAS